MKLLLPLLTLSFLTSNALAASSMKPEGSCQGQLVDGTTVVVNYYSDFDGCKDKSEAAISFTEDQEGLYTGKRTFTEDKDIYTFNKDLRLILNNSTGNSEATLRYLDQDGGRQSAILQCEVRDYEYQDC